MKNYSVLLHGKNFILKFDEKPQRFGFYTTRFVRADDEREAEKIAVDLIRNSRDLKMAVLNEKNDPPMIYLKEISEISFLTYRIRKPGKGFTFYPEDESNEPE